MNTNGTAVGSESADAQADCIPTTSKRWGRFRWLTLLLSIVATLALTSPPADAATAPAVTTNSVTYGYGGIASVTRIGGYTCSIVFHNPSSVLHFAGTAELFQYVELDRPVNGVWQRAQYLSSTATTWVASGNQLQSIYWNNDLPGSVYQFGVTAGNTTYRVQAGTEWWTGSSWQYVNVQIYGYPTC